MNVRRLGAVALRQFYLYAGSPTRLVPLFVWVALDIAVWGFITRYLNSIASPGFDFVPALLGAVLLWDFLTRVMQGGSPVQDSVATLTLTYDHTICDGVYAATFLADVVADLERRG